MGSILFAAWGALLDSPLAVPAGMAGTVIVARSACRWARRRCDRALAAARAMPDPAERLFAVRPDIIPLSPELLRDQRALQQVLDQAMARRPAEAAS